MKKVLGVGVVLVSALFITGCSDPDINYEGELLPAHEVEERIADKLEVENPDLDLEVNISEETDD